jgi:hypothetical protein
MSELYNVIGRGGALLESFSELFWAMDAMKARHDARGVVRNSDQALLASKAGIYDKSLLA